ncbi:type IV pilin protein [Candidatus Ruminimicrobiellum ovillum]|uniref:type IV pilin protein n=1 Tax=Candidatus Ruminimicrobiellum ovillum TaxID=1947927 RepID=UPI00355A6E03
MKRYNRGFTLLEMLVIIVIVSVLSIVGKLSYDISVEKAICSEFVPTVIAIQNAQLAYYVEHRRYADSIFDLDLDLEGVKEYDFHPLTSNTGFKGNGHGIRTKYFIYGTYLFEERKDNTGNGEIEYKPYIHAYRYTKRFKSTGVLDYMYNPGVSLYNIEDPTKKMDYRSVRFVGDRVKIYVFKKALKSLISNWHSHMDD